MRACRKIRVLVVDEDPLTLRGIVASVNDLKSYVVCGVAETASRARQLCAELRPDLLVMELPLPSGDGLGLLREVTRQHLAGRVVVLGAFDDRPTVEQAFRAGARGYVQRADAPAAWDAAFAAVRRDEWFVSHRAEQSMLASLSCGRATTRHGDGGRLSDRELEVFAALGRGHGPKAIALGLGISVKTVESHLQKGKAKLGVRTCAELRQRAKRWLAGQGPA